MDITIDAARMSPMLGRVDVFNALLDAMGERRGSNEAAQVLKLRLQRSLQHRDLTVRVANAGATAQAQLNFVARTVTEVHPRPRLVLVADATAPEAGAPARQA